MSYMINNNALEIDPSPRKKRKRSLQCTNAFMNPALDILSTDDPMCNNIMEVVAPVKRSRRSKSCDSRVSFENPALDLGSNRKDINDLLRKELANVNRKLESITEVVSPLYQNNSFNDVIIEEKSVMRIQTVPRDTFAQVNSTPVVDNSVAIAKRRASFDLSFIEKLGIDDSTNGEALYLDDDLNESNIMEIKTITLNSNKKQQQTAIKRNTNPFLNCQIDYDAIEPVKDVLDNEVAPNNFPFDVPVSNSGVQDNVDSTVSSYDATSASSDPEIESITSADNAAVVPRRLFADESGDNSIQYIDESSIGNDNKQFGHSTLNDQINCRFASESCRTNPVFVFSGNERINKQSKILGCDVSNMSQNEIFNCKNNAINSKVVTIPNINNNIQATFKDNSQRTIFPKKKPTKLNHKISTKIFSKIKDVFKHDKKAVEKTEPVSGNPYEVVRKAPTQDKTKKPLPACFVNPALNLNNSTDMEFEEVEDESISDQSNTEPQFNSRNPFEITPMKRAKENCYLNKENIYSSQNSALNNCVDLSDLNFQPDTTGKKHVRFDSTLNHQKLITGNSFDSDNFSSGSGSNQVTQIFHHIDEQIDEYHNELENCFNEKKFISQNI